MLAFITVVYFRAIFTKCKLAYILKRLVNLFYLNMLARVSFKILILSSLFYFILKTHYSRTSVISERLEGATKG